MRHWFVVVVLLAIALPSAQPAAAAPAPCRYILGFQALHHALPMIVGSCRDDQELAATHAHYGPNDPLCCSRLPPVRVAYAWTGARLLSDGAPPRWGRRPIEVRYRG